MGKIINGTDASETLRGTNTDDWIDGLGGNDKLYGKGGDDWLTGGDGSDKVWGGDGNDQLTSWLGLTNLGEKNLYDGGTGNDTLGYDIFIKKTTDRVFKVDLPGGRAGFTDAPGFDTLTGIENVFVMSDFDTKMYGDGRGNTFGGGWGNDLLRGGGGADDLFGDDGNDRLYGEAGDDTLGTGGGKDRLFGGGGDDRLKLQTDGAHVLDGGPGIDRLDVNGFALTPAPAPFVVDLVTGVAGFDGAGPGGTATVSGLEQVYFYGDIDARLTGDGADNRLLSEGGADILRGGAGDDFGNGGEGNDQLFGGAGKDWLQGSEGDDLLDGGGGNDRLEGGAGNDTLIGSAGKDKLDPGIDSDADTILFADVADTSAAAKKADRILNFDDAHDLVDLSGIDANTGTPDDQAFAYAGDAGPAANSLWVAFNDKGMWLHGDVTGDLVPDLSIFFVGIDEFDGGALVL